jgi:restriction system protein
MALWVVRTGKYGEHEQRFLDSNRLYLTWEGFDRDLGKMTTRDEMVSALQEVYPDAPLGRARNNAAQFWAFAKKIAPGDWVIVPSKQKSAVHVAEMVGPYEFDAAAEDPYYHSRAVKWIARDVPRTALDADLRLSIGAMQSIFAVWRNDAEKRVRQLAKAGWLATPSGGGGVKKPGGEDDEGEDVDVLDLESVAQDQIAQAIIRQYKGHGLERLVEAVLQAQGYVRTTARLAPTRASTFSRRLGRSGSEVLDYACR